jgi:hypothetical protein
MVASLTLAFGGRGCWKQVGRVCGRSWSLDCPSTSRSRSGSAATVSINVRDLAQLFNSFDPSPLWDRDLDRVAAEFIEEEFRDKQSAEVWHDGPVASSLRVAVPDLTRLAFRQGGRFSADQVRRVIDGRAPFPPYGMRDISVWGQAFRVAVASGPQSERRADGLIELLVEYLRSIRRE